MIESFYWKQELQRSAASLAKGRNRRRWTLKAVVLYEHEIVISFFSIRKLIEDEKLTDLCRDQTLSCNAFPNRGARVDSSNRHRIDELYNMGLWTKEEFSLNFVANQIIHSYIMHLVFEKDRSIEGILVCSDYERNKRILHIPLGEVLRVTRSVAQDRITSIHSARKPKTGDMKRISAK